MYKKGFDNIKKLGILYVLGLFIWVFTLFFSANIFQSEIIVNLVSGALLPLMTAILYSFNNNIEAKKSFAFMKDIKVMKELGIFSIVFSICSSLLFLCCLALEPTLKKYDIKISYFFALFSLCLVVISWKAPALIVEGYKSLDAFRESLVDYMIGIKFLVPIQAFLVLYQQLSLLVIEKNNEALNYIYVFIFSPILLYIVMGFMGIYSKEVVKPRIS